MFGKKDHRKRGGGGIFGIFRLIWSLVILAILAVGLLQAYKYFSGYDVLKVDPKSTLKSLLSADGAYNFITGLLTLNPSSTLDKAKQALSDQKGNSTNPQDAPKGELDYKFAVLADSHKDTTNLTKALKMAKDMGAKFVIGMGDFSDVGTSDELRNTKIQFDTSTLPYYVSAGDHDLWDSRNKNQPANQNFSEIFGNSYQAFTYQNARFIIIYNSDNYLGLDEVQLKWIEDQIDTYKSNPTKFLFVVAPTPLYHPSSDHVMGKVTPKLKDQAQHLISIFKRAGADEVFSADTHFFSRFEEPVQKLKMTTVGALTSDRNPQTPRFAMVDIFTNGSYNIEEIEVK